MDANTDQAEAPVEPPHQAPDVQPAGDPPHFVHYEVAYGADQRLSFAIRVF
jgi:hypothetical protein